MGTKDFKLPDVGEGVAEGELVSWLVAPGDTVEEDQPVAEVETDKALVEVPSPYNGTVKELHVEEGTMVPVGDVIITYEVEGEGDEPAEPAAEAEPEESAEAEPEEAETAETEAATEDAEPAESSAKGGRVFAAPSARRLARELGVDIATVDGSGPSGRVTDADVRQAAESGEEGDEEAEDGPRDVDIGGESSVTKRGEAADGETPSAAPDAAGRDRTLAAPATRRMANEQGVDLNDVPATEQRDGEAFVSAAAVTEYAEAQQAAQEADAQAVAEEGAADAEAEAEPSTTAAAAGGEGGLSGERIPYRGVRRTIGEAMQNSKFTAPHVTHHDSTDVSALVELRAELKEVAAERDVKLSYMPFVMKAIAAALKQYPYMNATLDEENEEIVLRDEYHIGVAVATDAGLMVPVVEDVDKKGLLEIAEDMNDKIERARDRSISRDELRGSTFTITNFGVVGGEYATPIINYPEVGIMGLGELTERPVVEDGEVVARHTLPLSLSIDHRILDGAVAAEFANKVMEYLQHPKLLLLE
jgi:pyruvate dehydrogenase E2 component (dihydrolipoamide acetyltransferase)